MVPSEHPQFAMPGDSSASILLVEAFGLRAIPFDALILAGGGTPREGWDTEVRRTIHHQAEGHTLARVPGGVGD